ncbi:MAG: trypsin-like serine protease [Proteobacteria bacterium]|nr:MAG: trypsin-like serine protease [Pseudomonadota bacterium]
MKFHSRLLASSLILCLSWSCNERIENSSETKIIGGSPTSSGSWKAVVGITHADEGIFCTGTALNANLVVTAAHCLEGQNAKDLRIYVGNGQAYNDVIGTFQIERIGIHPDWEGEDNDIGFLVLKNPLSLKLVPADYPKLLLNYDERKELLAEGAMTFLVGFGSTSPQYPHAGSGGSSDLQDAIDALEDWGESLDRSGTYGVKHMAAGHVHKYLAGTSFNSANEIILGGNGVDTCQGDSGGPAYGLLKNGRLRVYGITSRGVGCGNGGVSGLIFAHVCWLEQASQQDLDLPAGYCR